MAWNRRPPEEQEVHNVEERLAELVKSQSALNKNTQEIKDITAEIVKTLNSGLYNDLLLARITFPPSNLSHLWSGGTDLEHQII